MRRRWNRPVLLASIGGLAAVLTLPAATSAPAAAATTTTLLSVSFDNLATGSVTPSEFRSTFGGGPTASGPYARASIVNDAMSGDRAFRISVPRGAAGPSSGFAEVVKLARPVDNACISYKARFDGSFDWSLGGKLPGLSGVAPSVDPGLPAGGGRPGDKGWSSRIMWRTAASMDKASASAATPDMATQYDYGPRQVDYYGDSTPWYRKFVAGTWHQIKMCFTLNTVGRSDGIVKTWLDGNAGVNKSSYVFRTRSDVHITHLMMSVFRGGSSSSWSGSRNDWIDLDDVKVTTTS